MPLPHRTTPHRTALSQIVTVDADRPVPAAFDGKQSLAWKPCRYSLVTGSSVVVCAPYHFTINCPTQHINSSDTTLLTP